MRADQAAQRLEAAFLGHGADEERRRAGDAGAAALALILPDLRRRCELRGHALLERGHREAKRLGVFGQVRLGQRLLIVEQPIVKLPEAALLVRALGGFRRAQRARVQAFDRQVPEHVADLAAVHIFLDDLRVGIARVAAAERALEIGKLEEDQFGVGLTLRW